MNTKKFSDFFERSNRQTPPKNNASGRSMRLSNLTNEEDDVISSDISPPDKLKVDASRSSSNSFTNNSLSFDDVIEVVQSESSNINEDTMSKSSDNVKVSPEQTIKPSSLPKSENAFNSSYEKTKPLLSSISKRPSVTPSDVSAADIHAILDAFPPAAVKKERRKPSDVAKGKHVPSNSPQSISETTSQSISEPVISPWITQPPAIDSSEQPSEAEEVESFGKLAASSESGLDAKTNDSFADISDLSELSEIKKSQTLPAKLDLEFNSNMHKLSSSAGSSPIVSRKTEVHSLSDKISPVDEFPKKVHEFVSDSLPEKEKSLSMAPIMTSDDPPKSHRHKKRSSHDSFNISYAVCAVIILLIALLYFLPISSYLIGFSVGVACTLALVHLYNYLITPTPGRNEPLVIPSLRDLPPPSIPEIAEDSNSNRCHRSWFNELNHYNPEKYHLSFTHSVYVTLEGTQLRLQRPKTNIPRRAMYNEQVSVSPASFVHQRIFDILHTKVMLLPQGLVKKRVWSKKYPICIVMNRESSKISGAAPVTKSTSTPNLKTRATIPTSGSSENGFEVISSEEAKVEHLYLFARTSREKEEWFNRFQSASLGISIPTSLRGIAKTFLEEDTHITGSTEESGGESRGAHMPVLVSYLRYMAKFMPAEWLMKTAQMQSECLKINYISCDPQVLWLNAILGRSFWDFFRESYWVSQVREKIQNKLKKIHLPYFIDELTVVDIDLGSDLPVIRRASRPYLDLKGLWVDLDVAYAGGFVMSLETKVNLLKVKENSQKLGDMFSRSSKSGSDRDPSMSDDFQAIPSCSSSASESGRSTPKESHSRRIAAFREDEEDSAESSTDSDDDLPSSAELQELEKSGGAAGGGTSRRFMRFVDRVSKSKYFAKALDNKYIQRGMEFVSNTKLVLQVEVQYLNGTLAVNIPAPPSNRLWYGFRNKPQLKITARPKVGEKKVTMSKITEWIEEKLILEFQRVVVMPNMDDLIIPLLCSGNPENYGHQF